MLNWECKNLEMLHIGHITVFAFPCNIDVGSILKHLGILHVQRKITNNTTEKHIKINKIEVT